MATQKNDRVAPRTVEDLQRKYQFGRSFSEVMGIAQDVQRSYQQLKGVTAKLTEDLDKISASVSQMYEDIDEKGYATMVQVKNEISASLEGIELSVEEIESLKDAVNVVKGELALKIVEEVQDDGTIKKVSKLGADVDRAEFNVGELVIKSEEFTLNQDGTVDIPNYATTESVASALELKADSAALSVYATKKELATKADSSALIDYAKVSEMNSALSLKADSADLGVYAKITEVDSALLDKADASYVKEIQGEISLKINKEELVSELNASADDINIEGNRISIKSDNFELDKKGSITAKKGNIANWDIFDGAIFKDVDGIFSGMCSTNLAINKFPSLTSGGRSPARFYAGSYAIVPNTQVGRPNFLVLEDGSLYASGARIGGDVTFDTTAFEVMGETFMFSSLSELRQQLVALGNHLTDLFLAIYERM